MDLQGWGYTSSARFCCRPQTSSVTPNYETINGPWHNWSDVASGTDTTPRQKVQRGRMFDSFYDVFLDIATVALTSSSWTPSETRKDMKDERWGLNSVLPVYWPRHGKWHRDWLICPSWKTKTLCGLTWALRSHYVHSTLIPELLECFHRKLHHPKFLKVIGRRTLTSLIFPPLFSVLLTDEVPSVSTTQLPEF